MWKNDKNYYIGIFGALITIIVFMLNFYIEPMEKSLLLIQPLLLCLFIIFSGTAVGGTKFGLGWLFQILLTLGVFTGAFYSADIISNILIDNNIVSEGFGALINLILIFLNVYLIYKIVIIIIDRLKLGDESKNNQDIINIEEGIFLIEPRLKHDRVYKVINKDHNLYFCRVGGQSQSYEILEIEKEYTESKEEKSLLSDQNNCKIDINKIDNIELSRKKTDIFPKYNGKVIIRLKNKKSIKYYIHKINRFEEVKNCLQNIIDE